MNYKKYTKDNPYCMKLSETEHICSFVKDNKYFYEDQDGKKVEISLKDYKIFTRQYEI